MANFRPTISSPFRLEEPSDNAGNADGLCGGAYAYTLPTPANPLTSRQKPLMNDSLKHTMVEPLTQSASEALRRIHISSLTKTQLSYEDLLQRQIELMMHALRLEMTIALAKAGTPVEIGSSILSDSGSGSETCVSFEESLNDDTEEDIVVYPRTTSSTKLDPVDKSRSVSPLGSVYDGYYKDGNDEDVPPNSELFKPTTPPFTKPLSHRRVSEIKGDPESAMPTSPILDRLSASDYLLNLELQRVRQQDMVRSRSRSSAGDELWVLQQRGFKF